MNKILKKIGTVMLILIALLVTSYSALALGTTDLVSYYSFDTDYQDEYGGNDGTNDGTVITAGVGILSGSAYFDGSDKITVAGISTCPSAYSFSFWTNYTTSGDADTIIDQNTPTGWKMYKSSTPYNHEGYVDSAGAWNTGSSIGTNVWTHHVITHNGGAWVHYINGVSAGTGTRNEGACAQLELGGKTIGQAYTGYIDELAYYDAKLELADVTELYNSGAGYNPVGGGDTSSDHVNITNMKPTNGTNFTTQVIPFNMTLNITFASTCTLNIDGVANDTESVSSGNDQAITFDDQPIADGNHYYNFFCGNSTHNDTSTTLNFTVDYWREVNMTNEWNRSTIDIFNGTCGATTYTTTNGILLLPFSDTQNCEYDAPNYVAKNYTFNFANLNNPNGTLYMSELYFNSTEVVTGSAISNFTIFLDGQNFTTTNNTIYIRPNYGTFSVNWTNTLGYFNFTGVSMTIDEGLERQTITNVFARNITFENARGVSQQITPNCTQSGNEYSSYPYLMPLDSSGLNCTLTGYQDENFTLNGMPDSSVYNMTPAMLWLIFSELTQGYVETEDCSASPSNCAWFNSTSLYVEQANVSEGRVVVKFNPDGSGNWQQIFEYNNDGDTHVKEYLQIITPDLVQTVKVTGNKVPLEDARVVAKVTAQNPDTNLTDWITVYSDFTNVDGESEVLINDEDTYKFCASADGYTTKCIIQFVPPTSTTTIAIDLDPSESAGGYDFISTSCGNVYIEGMNCTLEVNTHKTYNTICVNYTTASGSAVYCSSDSISKIFTYTLDNTTGNVTLEVFLDGVSIKTLRNNWQEYDPYNLINWESETDIDGNSLLDRVKSETQYLIAVYIILTIIGVIMGFMAEKYFNGYGPYGSMVWFAVMGIGGFYIFWIPTIILAIYGIMDKLIPLFQNT